MNLVEIGQVRFFTNVPSGLVLTDVQCVAVALAVKAEFLRRLRASGLGDEVVVARVEYERGCIITGLTLAVVAGGLYKFVANYKDKIRPGLIQIWADMKAIPVIVAEKLPPQTTWPYDPALSTTHQMQEVYARFQRGELVPVETSDTVTQVQDRPKAQN